jgi:tripartite-type tricarboxylate transporter receptor subunit TctC
MTARGYAVTTAALLALGLGQAHAEWKPDRPITMIIAFAAGGGTDTVARAAAAVMQQEFGQPVNVVNRPGAGGLTGTLEMARAEPDGYTIGLAATNLNVHGWQQPGSVTPEDFTPIALINTNAAGFQVAADSPFQTLAEAMEAFKADPQSFTSSASGVGGVWHIGLLKLAMSQGIDPADIVFIPTGGAAPSLNELIAGGVDFAPTAVAESGPQIRSGQVRSLGVMAEERLEAFPDIPTVGEALGTPVLHYSWTGFVAPLGTPDDVIEAYRKAARAVSESEQFRQQLSSLGFGLSYAEGDAFATFMAEQYQSSGDALRAAGMIQ